MITGMPRIAIAVHDFTATVELFRDKLGMPVIDVSDSSVQQLGAKLAMCTPAGGSNIELMSPGDPATPLSQSLERFLARRGEGLFALMLPYLAACSVGREFDRPPPGSLQNNETTKQGAFSRYGDPFQTGILISNDHQIENITYAYAAKDDAHAPIGDGPNMAEKGTSLRHWGLIIRPTSIWVVP